MLPPTRRQIALDDGEADHMILQGGRHAARKGEPRGPGWRHTSVRTPDWGEAINKTTKSFSGFCRNFFFYFFLLSQPSFLCKNHKKCSKKVKHSTWSNHARNMHGQAEFMQEFKPLFSVRAWVKSFLWFFSRCPDRRRTTRKKPQKYFANGNFPLGKGKNKSVKVFLQRFCTRPTSSLFFSFVSLSVCK